MIAIKLILLLGVLLTLWISYSLIYYFYGDKIKAYFAHQLDIYRSTKHYQETQKANRLRMYRDSLPEEVEVIDEGVRTWDLVSRTGERTPNQFIFEISNLPIVKE